VGAVITKPKLEFVEFELDEECAGILEGAVREAMSRS
jgi:hypothetical protein